MRIRDLGGGIFEVDGRVIRGRARAEAYVRRKEALLIAPPLPISLVGTVAVIARAIAFGAADDHLDDLEAAEKAGKHRVGVIDAIERRRKAL